MKKLIAVAVLLIMGCGTLTKDKFFRKSIKTEKLNQTINEVTNSQKTLTIKDSTETYVEFTLFPKGKFTLSPTRGFEGEAFSLVFKGKQSQLTNSEELSLSKQKSSVNLKVQKEQVQKLKEKRVEWEGIGYGIGFLFLLLLVLVVWFVRKRLA